MSPSLLCLHSTSNLRSNPSSKIFFRIINAFDLCFHQIITEKTSGPKNPPVSLALEIWRYLNTCHLLLFQCRRLTLLPLIRSNQDPSLGLESSPSPFGLELSRNSFVIFTSSFAAGKFFDRKIFRALKSYFFLHWVKLIKIRNWRLAPASSS